MKIHVYREFTGYSDLLHGLDDAQTVNVLTINYSYRYASDTFTVLGYVNTPDIIPRGWYHA